MLSSVLTEIVWFCFRHLGSASQSSGWHLHLPPVEIEGTSHWLAAFTLSKPIHWHSWPHIMYYYCTCRYIKYMCMHSSRILIPTRKPDQIYLPVPKISPYSHGTARHGQPFLLAISGTPSRSCASYESFPWRPNSDAYNTLTIHGVISQNELPESVLKVKQFWRTTAYRIGGHVFSLDDIEHGILRGRTR